MASNLEHTPVLAGRFDHQPPLANGEAERLFRINMFACLARIDRDQGPPVVDGCRDNGVNVLPLQQFAIVLVRLAPMLLGDLFSAGRFTSATATKRVMPDLTAAARTTLPCRPMPIPAMPILSLAPGRPGAAKMPEGTRYGAAQRRPQPGPNHEESHDARFEWAGGTRWPPRKKGGQEPAGVVATLSRVFLR